MKVLRFTVVLAVTFFTHPLLADPPAPVPSGAPPITPANLRVKLDWSYGIAYASGFSSVRFKDTTPTRETVIIFRPRDNGLAQSLSVSIAYAIEHELALGLDLQLHQTFARPSHPWLDQLGLHMDRRRSFGFGAFAELTPWEKRYCRRNGFFFQGGIRVLRTNERLQRDPSVTPTTATIDESAMSHSDVVGWVGSGYRTSLFKQLSVHSVVDGGMTGSFFFVGFRIGGSIH